MQEYSLLGKTNGVLYDELINQDRPEIEKNHKINILQNG